MYHGIDVNQLETIKGLSAGTGRFNYFCTAGTVKFQRNR
jgi:hypothetical protein